MYKHDRYTEILQWHNGIAHFDYDLSIDWAIELIRRGVESENVLIVASFSKPVDREEIRPYISGALKELGLAEKYGDYSLIANAHYDLDQILNGHEVRGNLFKLKSLYLETDFDRRLQPFYLLYHAWRALEEYGENYYFEGVDLNNIELVLKQQAQLWIDEYVHGKSIIAPSGPSLSGKDNSLQKESPKSLWQWIKQKWK